MLRRQARRQKAVVNLLPSPSDDVSRWFTLTADKDEVFAANALAYLGG